MPPLVETLVPFAVSLVVGGVSLFVAAQLLHRGGRGVEHAVVTALLGALVWGLLSWVPLVGGLLALAGWVLVLAWRYPGGFLRALVMGVVAWVVAVVLLSLLTTVGIGAFGVIGVPGV